MERRILTLTLAAVMFVAAIALMFYIGATVMEAIPPKVSSEVMNTVIPALVATVIFSGLSGILVTLGLSENPTQEGRQVSTES